VSQTYNRVFKFKTTRSFQKGRIVFSSDWSHNYLWRKSKRDCGPTSTWKQSHNSSFTCLTLW